MNEKELEARLRSIEARLDELDGGSKEESKKAPPSPKTFVKREENQFPKWVYAVVDGELKSALIDREEDMPEGAAESPEEALAGVSGFAPDPAPMPDPEPTEPAYPADPAGQSEAPIPEDWQALHHFKRIALAKSLPGGEDVTTADDADALIELELERRGNA